MVIIAQVHCISVFLVKASFVILHQKVAYVLFFFFVIFVYYRFAFFLSFIFCAHHILHVGGRRVDLTPQLVVQVEDEVLVSLADGPFASGPGLPPALVLVLVLIQD